MKDLKRAIARALSRGYCSKRNENKILDPDLIEDMAKEISALFEKEIAEYKLEYVKKYKTIAIRYKDNLFYSDKMVEALELQLAKARETLKYIVDHEELAVGGEYDSMMAKWIHEFVDIAKATLTEIGG